MAKNGKPRKAYRPRMVNAPMTQGLMADFNACLQRGQIGLLMNPSTAHFDDVARVLNVVAKATILNPLPKEMEPDCRVMAGGMSAMQQLADRAEKSGQWSPQRYEVEPIALACERAMNILKKLDVRTLYRAMKELGR